MCIRDSINAVGSRALLDVLKVGGRTADAAIPNRCKTSTVAGYFCTISMMPISFVISILYAPFVPSPQHSRLWPGIGKGPV